MENRIPVYLITGFLGAGKTSLVNHLLTGGLGEGTGLLVNDFGDVVVDGSLIRKYARSENKNAASEGKDLDIFEVAGGSIFCSCKTDNFALGLRMFAKIRPQRLFVEASGMSDPSGFDKLLSDYRLAADFELNRIICLADAFRTPMMLDNLPALLRQVEAANLILLNKTDLVDETLLAPFEARLSNINPEARIIRTVHAEVDVEEIAGGAGTHLRGVVESCNLPSNRPGTLQLESENIPRDSLDAFLHDHLSETWRIKGWVKSDDRWWYISDNAGRIEWKEESLPDGMLPGLTVITPAGAEQNIADDWNSFIFNQK